MARRQTRIAFTIIELLIVIAAISLLMTILFPCLTGAREAARSVKCMANLRNIGYYTQNYCFNNSGRFPEFFFSFTPGKSSNFVILVVPKRAASSGWSNYNEDVLVCPSDSVPGTVPVRLHDDSIVRKSVSYGYNIDLLLTESNYEHIPCPCERAIFFDGSMSDRQSGGKIQGAYRDSKDFALSTQTTRHFGTANFLFLDWHVESFRPDEVNDRMIYGWDVPADSTKPGGGSGKN